MALFLFLLLVAVVLGAIGLLAEGFFWLLIIGALVLVVDLILLGIRLGRGQGARRRR